MRRAWCAAGPTLPAFEALKLQSVKAGFHDHMEDHGITVFQSKHFKGLKNTKEHDNQICRTSSGQSQSHKSPSWYHLKSG